MKRTLICREHRSKYCNPHSPRHVGHYVSPIPDASSSIWDQELADYEHDLSIREKKFLGELTHFHANVEKYEHFKFELDKMADNVKQQFLAPEEIKIRLNFIKKLLDERAKNAEAIYSQPIPDYSEEAKEMLQLEKEADELEAQQPKESISETVAKVAQMMLDTQTLEAENLQLKKNIEIKNDKLQREFVLLEEKVKQFECIEREEEHNNQDAQNEKARLDSLPKFELDKIIDIEKKKEELDGRRQKTIILTKKLKLDSKKAKEVVDKIQEEIKVLEKELETNYSKNDKMKSVFTQIQKTTEMNNQIKETLTVTEEDLAQLKRKIDLQKDDIRKIDSKKKHLEKREHDINDKKKILIEKDKEIKKRSLVLDNSENQITSIKAELNEMKLRIQATDKEVAKYQKLSKSMIDKVSEALEIIESKSIEIIDAPSQKQLGELQNLITKGQKDK